MYQACKTAGIQKQKLNKMLIQSCAASRSQWQVQRNPEKIMWSINAERRVHEQWGGRSGEGRGCCVDVPRYTPLGKGSASIIADGLNEQTYTGIQGMTSAATTKENVSQPFAGRGRGGSVASHRFVCVLAVMDSTTGMGMTGVLV